MFNMWKFPILQQSRVQLSFVRLTDRFYDCIYCYVILQTSQVANLPLHMKSQGHVELDIVCAVVLIGIFILFFNKYQL